MPAFVFQLQRSKGGECMKVQIKQADDLLVTLEDAFKGFPKLPKGFTDFVVAIAPWVALIFGVITLLGMVFGSLIGFIGSIAYLFTGAPIRAVVLLVVIAIGIAEGVLMVLSFKPLQKREMEGWRLMGYVNLLGVASAIVSFVGSWSIVSLVWSAIMMAIGFYILFQIKHYYK